MFCINERSRSAKLLGFGDYMQRNCRFTGRFRAINLNNSTAWNAAHAKGKIQLQATGRDRGNADLCSRIAQLHHSALTKLFFDLA